MYGISGNGFFLPAAILNFINLQGTLIPHCTYHDSVVVCFRGAIHTRTGTQTRVYVCMCVFIRIHINKNLGYIS